MFRSIENRTVKRHPMRHGSQLRPIRRRIRLSGGSTWLVQMLLVPLLMLLPSQQTTGQQNAGQQNAGQQPPADPPSAVQRTEREPTDVGLLSESNYAARRQATLEMWRNRDRSRDAVQRAARNADPEIAGRAQWILRQWRRGALPETPPEISRLLDENDHPSSVLRLLENGQFQAAVVAVEESAGTPLRESISRRVGAIITQRFPRYARLAFQSDSIPELLQLIDLIAETPEMALCRLRLMQYLDLPIETDSLLPTASSVWTEIDQRRTRILLTACLGHRESALDMALAENDPDTVRLCQMIAGDWDGLKRTAFQAIASSDGGGKRTAQPSETTDLQTWQRWSDVLAGAIRSGDTTLRSKAVARLSADRSDLEQIVALESPPSSEPNHPDDSLQQPWNARWRALATHGELEPAMEILAALDPTDAANLWLALSRPEMAMQTLGVSRNQIDQQLHQWIEQATRQQPTDPPVASGTTQQITTKQLILMMQVLLSVGQEDAAWLIASQLCLNELPLPEDEDQDSITSEVLDSLVDAGKHAWAAKLATQMNLNSKSTDAESMTASGLSAILGSLPENSNETLEVLLEGLRKMNPNWTLIQRVQAAGELLRGEVPGRLNAPDDLHRLLDFASRPRSTRGIAVRLRGGARLRGNLDLVKMFLRLDYPDLANQLLEALVQSGDPDAVIEVADRALDAGDLDGAESVFESILQIGSGRNGGGEAMLDTRVVNQTHRITSYPSLAIIGKALVGRWIVARCKNDHESADTMEQQIRLCLCGPSDSLRRTIADYLDEKGEQQWAAEIYEAMLAASWFDSQGPNDFFFNARRYAMLVNESDPASAAAWFDLVTLRIMNSSLYPSTAYVSLPSNIHRWSLDAAIKNGNAAEAEIQIQRVLLLDPLNVDLCERQLPKMRAAGMEDLADAVLSKMMKACGQHAQKFPEDAVTMNNVAWVAAVNGQHLDQALQLSRRAVRLEPDSAVYRDTLAEILFLKQETDQAIQIETHCLLDDPGQWHLHQQIQKFTEPDTPRSRP